MEHIENTKASRVHFARTLSVAVILVAYRRRIIAAGRCHADTRVSVLFSHRIRVPDHRHMQEPKVQ